MVSVKYLKKLSKKLVYHLLNKEKEQCLIKLSKKFKIYPCRDYKPRRGHLFAKAGGDFNFFHTVLLNNFGGGYMGKYI